MSGEANLGRLENNLVTAVGGCWGQAGGVGGGEGGGGTAGRRRGLDRLTAVRTRLTLHSFPVNAERTAGC